MTTTKVIIHGKTVKAERWQDPCGPTHTFYTWVEGKQLPGCPAANYHCVRVFDNQPLAWNMLKHVVPKLSEVEWAEERGKTWKEEFETPAGLSFREYRSYVEETTSAYYSVFLKKVRDEETL